MNQNIHQGCLKCGGTGFVLGESKKAAVINGVEFEYPVMKFCDCRMSQKEKQLKNKINSKSSWVDKYRKKEQDDEG